MSQRAAFRQQDIYEHLFRHYSFLKNKANGAEREGKNAEAQVLRSIYKREAKLNEREAALLDEVASDAMNRVDELLARGQQVIAEARARVPGGQLKKGEAPPPPPAELETLQQERETIILQARERLRAELGAEAFTRFDDFVQRNIAGSMRNVMPLDRHRPKTRENPRR